MLVEKPTIPAFVPAKGRGHQFVCYADCCSGLPGGPNEATFAAVNAIVRRLDPAPEFICFPGDEIKGLTTDRAALAEQWRYWFEHEMAWLDREAIPLYHTTANHTVYDPMSETVFREVMAHLPQNGPDGQEGLSYWVRRDDLLLVFVNTLWSGRGGEGRVETEWLDQVLTDNHDACYRLVIGHHPVCPVNGFSGSTQREVDLDDGKKLWQILVAHGVQAYLCSHMLAFDVQVHDGVLQILTAGAGTAPLMPPESEYHHLVQMVLDADGLRYQVLDTAGKLREWLHWPFHLPPSSEWKSVSALTDHPTDGTLVVWRFSGETARDERGDPQTLLCGEIDDASLPPVWIGLRGPENRLTVSLAPVAGRSPHAWLGPEVAPGTAFDVQVGFHPGMGPGGLLWRWHDDAPWSSLVGASTWGLERLVWPDRWRFGSTNDRGEWVFRGNELHVSATMQRVRQCDS